MNRWVKGLLIGVGVAIMAGLGVVVLRGEQAQRFLRERYQQVRGALPEPEQVQHYARQVTDRVSQVAGSVKDTAQQTVMKVKNTGREQEDHARELTSAGSKK